MFTLDLQLTTLEFFALQIALQYFTRHAHGKAVHQLTDDELFLLPYEHKFSRSHARLIQWTNRRKRERASKKWKPLQPPRYSYKADWLLVKVLYRLLTTEPIPDEVAPLAGRFDQLILAQRTIWPTHTDPTAGIVDTSHIIV